MIRELALFAGGGGGLLASELLGFHTVAACEIDPYARKILLARQRDGILGKFPIWDDVRTFDGRPWRGTVDLISGGFPCQDISSAGRGAGLTGKNSGLFFEMLRIIKEVRPRFVFAENSPNLRTRGLVTVVQELDRLGYECRWCVLGAWHVGAPHKRNRMWIFAYLPDPDGEKLRHEQGRSKRPERENKTKSIDHGSARNVADPTRVGLSRSREFVESPYTTTEGKREADQFIGLGFDQVWSTEPALGRVAHGVAHRVDRLKALGNGQVPAVACLAWEILTSGILDNGPR